ncbi:hypothetical protein Hanom_Chr05g00390591 [Helianthus anomalus]
MLKETAMDKHMAINIHFDTISKLKQELEAMKIETERVDKKLISYSTASYILDHILPKSIRKDENMEDVYGYQNKGLGYHRVPPPMWNSYSKEKPDGVEKTLNLKLKTEQKDQLPHNIDVTYSKSDTDATSEVVKNVVEKVLGKENENNVFENNQPKFDKESSSPQPKSDQSFHDNYLRKSGNSSNDDPNILMYKMCGSHQLYSDSECEFDPSR